MQDPLTAAFQGPIGQRHPHDQQQQQQQLKCPRCDSTNTKFCYYNNYNLSQPRHFCKNCRRYWTKGGSLRNVPVGGGSRKSSAKRSSSPAPSNPPKRAPAASSPSLPPDPQIPKPEPPAAYPDDRMLDINDGSFSSLLGFGGLFQPDAPPPASANPSRPMGGASGGSAGENPPPAPLPENFLDSGCWAGGWPDLAIYTPGSSFQ